MEDAFISGQHDAVAYAGDPTESDDTFALDCTDSWDLQKPCDPSSSLAPGDIVQAPRLIRGSTTGSEESVQIVQATTSGWIVTRLGFPGAKVCGATRDGAEGWIVEQPLRKPLQWSKWFGSRRHGIDAATEAAQRSVRRQSAANFNGRVQQCDGDGDENNIMESQGTDHLALPPQ